MRRARFRSRCRSVAGIHGRVLELQRAAAALRLRPDATRQTFCRLAISGARLAPHSRLLTLNGCGTRDCVWHRCISGSLRSGEELIGRKHLVDIENQAELLAKWSHSQQVFGFDTRTEGR